MNNAKASIELIKTTTMQILMKCSLSYVDVTHKNNYNADTNEVQSESYI